MEIFKKIMQHENQYEISNKGRVRNIKTGNFISVRIGKIGYRMTNLWKNNKYKTHYVHRLIAIHFIPNPKNLSTVNHKDGNKINNDIKNLEWLSTKDNCIHSINTGLTPLGENRKNSKLTTKKAKQIYKMISSGKYARLELANKFNISMTQISQIKNKKEWKHIHKKIT